MRISDWSSDVCSSDLAAGRARRNPAGRGLRQRCAGRAAGEGAGDVPGKLAPSDRVSGGEGEGERAPAGCRVRALAADAGGRGDLPRSRIQESTVGWVERSETHRHALERRVSLRSTHPTPYPSYASGVLAPACSTSPPPNSLPSR